MIIIFICIVAFFMKTDQNNRSQTCDAAMVRLKKVAASRGTSHVGMCKEPDSGTERDCDILLKCLEMIEERKLHKG